MSCSRSFCVGFAPGCESGRGPDSNATHQRRRQKGHYMQLRADVVFEVLGLLPMTNTMLTALCATVVLITTAALLRLGLNRWPSRAQNAAKLLVESCLKVAETAGGGRARRFVPPVGTAFVFI